MARSNLRTHMLAVVIGLCSLCVPSYPGQAKAALSHPSLEKLVAISRDICKSPEQYGFQRGADGQISGELSLASLLKRLMGASISASIKGGVHDWKGPLQKDATHLATYQSDCASRIFIHMFDNFYLTDLTTERPIQKPKNAAATFQRENRRSVAAETKNRPTVAATHASTSVTAINPIGITGNSVSNVTQNNSIGTLNNYDAPVRRSDLRPGLQEIYARGAEILRKLEQEIPTDKNVAILKSDTQEWLNASYQWIQQHMTTAAAESFATISPFPRSYARQVPQTESTRTAYAMLRDNLPAYLENIRYLIDHDSMDSESRSPGTSTDVAQPTAADRSKR